MLSITLNPEITFTAIGALLGVTFTVATQTLNSLLQRRVDRVLKTYETKLDIFTDFLVAMQGIAETAAWIKKMDEDADLQEYLARKQTLASAEEDAARIEEELGRNPPPPPDRTAALRAEARDKSARLEERAAAIARTEPRLKRLAIEVAKRSEDLREWQAQFKKLSIKLRLISSGSGIKRSLARITSRVENGEPLTPDDYADFMQTAAKEVGIR